jgi:predicted nucleotidyltransferase
VPVDPKDAEIREASPKYEAALPIAIPSEAIARFCEAWSVRELSLFGSILNSDFGPSSDVDILIDLKPGTSRSVREYFAMVSELEGIVGRKVDLLEKRALVNPFRRASILPGARLLHAA